MINLEISTAEASQPGYPSEMEALLLALNYAISHYKKKQYLDADYMQQQALKAHQTVVEQLRERLIQAKVVTPPDLPPSLPEVPKRSVTELVKQIRELDETIDANSGNIMKLISLNDKRLRLQSMLNQQQQEKAGRSKSS